MVTGSHVLFALAPFAAVVSASALTFASSYANSTTTSSKNASLPVTGAGLSYALSCNAAKQSWISDSNNTVVKTIPTTTAISTETSLDVSILEITTTITHLRNSTQYTLCDGWPRLDGNTTMSSSEKDITSTSLSTATLTEDATVVETVTQAPNCVIASSDCAVLNSMYSESSSIYASSESIHFSEYDSWVSHQTAASDATNIFTGAPEPSGAAPASPLCDTIGELLPASFTSAVGPPSCAEAQVSVVLMYWPVSRISGNLCNASNASTATMSETITGTPNTFVTLGTTLTSPTNYIQVGGTWAYNVGNNRTTVSTGIWFPESASAISSYCIQDGGGLGALEAVDYANFNYPVPASAYRCQPKCHTESDTLVPYIYTQNGGSSGPNHLVTVTVATPLPPKNWCSTIWDDYAPALSVPQGLFSIQADHVINANMTCQFLLYSNNLLFDPPRALSEASSEAGVTKPNGNPATSTTLAPTMSPQPVEISISTVASLTSAPLPSSSTTTAAAASSTVAWPASETKAAGEGGTASSSSTIGIGGIIASVIGLRSSSSAISSLPESNSVQSPPGFDAYTAPNAVGVLESALRSSVSDPASSSNLVDPISVTDSTTTAAAFTSPPSQAYYTALSQTFVVDGTSPVPLAAGVILTPGAPAVTISGTTLSLATSASYLVIDGSSMAPITHLFPAETMGARLVITFDGTTVTEASDGGFGFTDDTTVGPGGVATISGHTTSVASSGGFAVVDGTTQLLDSSAVASADPTGTLGSPAAQSTNRGTSATASTQQTQSSSSTRIRPASALVATIFMGITISWAMIARFCT
ncbi:hypothetical protein LTR62_000944 [Meristemomyces frigidus]|uniref:Uncharacterized protein n=1 Tax=Meristemomyces frigidus TaxID=1508187 RepID=A0AAN7T9S1_9PEZI|nr:hypothetical protein LTR62_000944 [Meristemomyces frigidus]